MLNEQMRSLDEREFQHMLSARTLSARMEVEKQRALTEMVAGVAHEINTPLGIINTAVSIMARELAEPKEITTQRAAEIAESLELIRQNVERAHDLIQDFKKVSVSQLSSRQESVDVSEVVRETINLISVSLRRKNISINLHDNLSVDQRKWNGYRGLLSQILLNFLSNAERYAYPQHGGGVVDVSLEMDDSDWYRLAVRDHGRGISDEHITRIFNPFFTTGHEIGGTGLGLAIVQDLVTNVLKGEISVHSVPGNGAEFIARFPRGIPGSYTL
jgi:signal transduction histidine kinase